MGVRVRVIVGVLSGYSRLLESLSQFFREMVRVSERAFLREHACMYYVCMYVCMYVVCGAWSVFAGRFFCESSLWVSGVGDDDLREELLRQRELRFCLDFFPRSGPTGSKYTGNIHQQLS